MRASAGEDKTPQWDLRIKDARRHGLGTPSPTASSLIVHGRERRCSSVTVMYRPVSDNLVLRPDAADENNRPQAAPGAQ